ncbi:putative cytosol aminopeptidase [Hypericibacter adhaerens]|uniref:Probable cytosol aminopeptidase n=1 Tax=Hypericibacter adhaerens TaxID=2602016 RepID=A0A5J6MY13_9PROT|nr:leucyl aminopeptidase [Hypericibacter adhaerens]QEX21605.1 putative cytosol aminopeptidase [Hypericibacter adhaerens]
MRVRFLDKLPAKLPVLAVCRSDEAGLLPAARRVNQLLKGALARAGQRHRSADEDGPQIVELTAPRGLKSRRVLLLDLGRRRRLDGERAEAAGAALARAVAEAGETEAMLVLDHPEQAATSAPELATRLALGARLASYRFDRYRTKTRPDDPPGRLQTLLVVTPAAAAAQALWRKLGPVAAGVELARDLANEPSNVITPDGFIEHARAALAPLGVELAVFDEKKLARLGMNAMLAVGSGSANKPRLLLMRWRGSPGRPFAFVGKGVTFDTGGISIKKAAGMEEMKADMAGAAAVVGLMRALAGRRAKLPVIGVAALVENMPSGTAYRPGDVVKTFSGKTLEIVDTDAEGRVVLSDALAFTVQKFRPRAIVDLATLTYAVVAALGSAFSGIFANDDKLAERLVAAGQATGDRLWRLPLDAEYERNLKSQIADFRQCAPDDAFADASHGAQLLQNFVDGTPWAHLDIAGRMFGKRDEEGHWPGAPGFGVRLLDRFLATREQEAGHEQVAKSAAPKRARG